MDRALITLPHVPMSFYQDFNATLNRSLRMSDFMAQGFVYMFQPVRLVAAYGTDDAFVRVRFLVREQGHEATRQPQPEES